VKSLNIAVEFVSRILSSTHAHLASCFKSFAKIEAFYLFDSVCEKLWVSNAKPKK
jgi:hypothetical protein